MVVMKYYHVITRAHGEKTIFKDDADCLFYLHAVKDACKKYEIRWLAYAVMPTHTHLLWGGDLENITKARRKISYSYAVYARKKYPNLFSVQKKVIRAKNKVKWLQTNYDIKNEMRYIHLNPIEKNLETTLGASIRGSYNAVLSFWEPDNTQNPFNYFFALQEIRDALSTQSICRIFGNNSNAQKQFFLSFHQEKRSIKEESRPAFTGSLKIADDIVHDFFCKSRYYGKKTFDAKNREDFLLSLNRRNNPFKTPLICRISQETHLSTRAIADFLHIGHSTVKDILRKAKMMGAGGD